MWFLLLLMLNWCTKTAFDEVVYKGGGNKPSSNKQPVSAEVPASNKANSADINSLYRRSQRAQKKFFENRNIRNKNFRTEVDDVCQKAQTKKNKIERWIAKNDSGNRNVFVLDLSTESHRDRIVALCRVFDAWRDLAQKALKTNAYKATRALTFQLLLDKFTFTVQMTGGHWQPNDFCLLDHGTYDSIWTKIKDRKILKKMRDARKDGSSTGDEIIDGLNLLLDMEIVRRCAQTDIYIDWEGPLPVSLGSIGVLKEGKTSRLHNYLLEDEKYSAFHKTAKSGRRPKAIRKILTDKLKDVGASAEDIHQLLREWFYTDQQRSRCTSSSYSELDTDESDSDND